MSEGIGELILRFLDEETDNLPKGEPQYKMQMLALRIERAERKMEMGQLAEKIDEALDLLKGNGLASRVKELEEKENKREKNKEEKKETYWKPIVSGFVGAGGTWFFAWILGLLN